MKPHELARVREAIAAARAERAKDKTPRPATSPRDAHDETGSMSEDEERARADRPR